MLNIKDPILKTLDKSLIKLPTPMNISLFWNYGSLLGLYLLIQLISGILLSIHYCPNIYYAFDSIIHIMKDVKFGWLIRLTHMNGASMFFILMYIHIGRGIYYNSFKFNIVWYIGIMTFLLSMATAFLGYVLPWGQMSFWGATVITNLLSALPYIGQTLVEWIWGGFSINNATLNRFYSFHFILPMMIVMLVFIHLIYLHMTGSNNPLGTNSNYFKIYFHPYFTLKDILWFMIIMMIHYIIIMQLPYYLSDPDNFIPANPLSTPEHIKPEWYFLFAYSILRSIPNKLGGVLMLFMSILILAILPNTSNMHKIKTTMFYPLNQIMFWMFTNTFILLTWLGNQLIEYPYTEISQLLTIMYFSYFFITPLMNIYWDKLMFYN
uniref:Cytochrome b n=1 Tax=Hylaeus dilatatus TaxID=1542591 RepID=A0A0S2LTC5_9HYME|nr:cytochrome b [Hylaeus dilatatus]AJG02938.1 cytochrome b [Hylaeus dilatatus]ALO64648.1 cytochrome b [Hylaeus dilatatus]